MEIEENSDFHPLLLSPVIHKIFGYLSLWNQKKCRLVCKNWEEEARVYIRKSCKVNLSRLISVYSMKEKSLGNYVEDCCSQVEERDEKNGLIRGLSKICTSFIVEDNTPAIRNLLLQGNLNIKYLELRNFIWDLYQVQTTILKKLPSLEELRLPIQCAVPSTSSITFSTSTLYKREFLMNQQSGAMSDNNFETFPKLKIIIVTLTIKDLQFYHHKNTSVIPLLKLIQSTPNLEEIYYPNVVQFTSPFDNPARILFEGILTNTAEMSRLSTLKIDTFLTNEDLEMLQIKAFPLKSVQITVTPAISCKYLYRFLTSLGNSLDSLVLTFRDGFRLTNSFPKISSLKKMAIILWKGYLDYIQDILQLKTLIVVLVEMEDEIEERKCIEFSQKSNIKELDIHAARNAKSEVVQRLINLSPTSCLKRLTIDSVNDIQLQIIYQTLPSSLEELLILYGGFTPSGITGIPEKFCLDEYCDKEFFAKGLKKHRGIDDLKCLKHLVLTGDLTDFIIILGVAQCRTLKHLELTPRLSSKVSDRSIRKIAEMKYLDCLNLKNFKETTQSGWDYLNSRFEGKELYISA